MSNLELKFGQLDPGAKRDIITVQSQQAPTWATLQDLAQDNLPPPGNFATNEPNHTVADGTIAEFPDDDTGMTWGFFSSSMTNGSCEFEEPPMLEIVFDEPHKSPGLTLFFYPHTDDYASTVAVHWYSDAEATELLESRVFEVDSVVAQLIKAVDGYKCIQIEFLTTNHPNRYVKMWAMEFGITRIFGDETIDICKVLEEIDATSNSISINTLRAQIRTRDSVFSPITSPDFDDMMMEHQMLEVLRDGELFGVFFLEEWSDITQDGIVFDITAGDAMSMLDRYEFLGGMYIDEPVEALLDEIFGICFPTGLITYTLDVEFQGELITGYLPICSCGEAFQHIMFALNATADTARMSSIWIYGREVDFKTDSTAAATDEQAFAPASNLTSYVSPTYIPTLEPNYTLAGDSSEEFADDIEHLNLGWMSESMSDTSGTFANPPQLTIQFATTHYFRGMKLDFGMYEHEYIKRARVAFLDEAGALITESEYTFSSNPALLSEDVKGCRGIVIDVLETSAPERFAKIAFVEYGKSFYIPLHRQYRGGKDTRTALVSAVEVVSHAWSETQSTKDIHKGTFDVGVHEVFFRAPYHSLTVTGPATIVESHINYAVLDVAGTEQVVLSGKEYLHNTLSHYIAAPTGAGGTGDTKVYDAYTLVSQDRGQALAEKLFEHYKNRVETRIECVLDDLEVGYITEVETRGRPIVGTIVSADCNIRANRVDLEVVGHAVG